MSISYGALNTLAVVMDNDEAIELYYSWCTKFGHCGDDAILDEDDPIWQAYWGNELAEEDWYEVDVIDDGNCLDYYVANLSELDGCGSASTELDPFAETIWIIRCKRVESPFRTAYQSIDDVIDEYQNDEELMTYKQSRQWIKDHLLYLSAVMYG